MTQSETENPDFLEETAEESTDSRSIGSSDEAPSQPQSGFRRWGWLEGAFLAVMVVALGLRLFELSGRPMHYDEAIHLHYGWKLANSAGGLLGWPWIFGTDYVHSAWMHGPFQIEMTAVIFTIFGDTDFTSRLGYALFGTALVGLPYFLRDQIGWRGALIAAVMLALSPALLYFSRFGRNDIIMMFWAFSLFTLMWRYLDSGHRLNLYLASAILALMFATKETAYLLAGIFGLIVFLAALPDLLAWARGQRQLKREGSPTALLLLLVTITLPQWSAIIGLFQGLLGLTLANPDPLTGNNVANADGSSGMTGAPAWEGSTLLFPVFDAPWVLHAAAAVLAAAFLLWMLSRGPLSPERVAGLVGAPLLFAFATAWVLFRPYSGVDPSSSVLRAADWTISLGALAIAVGALFWSRYPVGRASLLALVPALTTALYCLLFTSVLDVQGIVDAVLPGGSMSIGAVGEGIPVNYVAAGVMLLGTLVISAALGIWWLGRAWLICAAVFYLIWAALYTTLFTNLAGIFTGSWQGMGYWIAQQDVARGNQPWYYYFVGLSVYEILPLAFGIAGIIYFFKRQDVLGLGLALWAVLSLAAYTVATEKMPWLLVNITTPFILVAAKYLGELSTRFGWKDIRERGGWIMAGALLGLCPLIIVAAVYLFLQFIDPDRHLALEHWLLLASTIAAAFVAAFIFRLSGAHRAAPVAGLGLAALLLAFGTWGAFRAAYTYDDSNVEVMVYAQGSADIKETYRTLETSVYPLSEGRSPVKVDYDVWYPLQWYVRNDVGEGRLNFHCFEAAEEENSACIVLENSLLEDGSFSFGNAAGLIVKDSHVGSDGDVRESYRKDGPFKELLWFPESYRRPDENREEEAMHTQLVKDFGFFRDSVSSRQSWAEVLDYLIYRKLDDPWYRSEYYAYLP